MTYVHIATEKKELTMPVLIASESRAVAVRAMNAKSPSTLHALPITNIKDQRTCAKSAEYQNSIITGNATNVAQWETEKTITYS